MDGNSAIAKFIALKENKNPMRGDGKNRFRRYGSSTWILTTLLFSPVRSCSVVAVVVTLLLSRYCLCESAFLCMYWSRFSSLGMCFHNTLLMSRHSSRNATLSRYCCHAIGVCICLWAILVSVPPSTCRLAADRAAALRRHPQTPGPRSRPRCVYKDAHWPVRSTAATVK